jgi:uncharacterized spore protein YtfJ
VKVSEMLGSLGDNLRVGASVRNVYGDPVTAGARTVIPIARVRYGFGAGGGEGRSPATTADRAGSGGGAGMSARPVGALEITEAGTRFIPLRRATFPTSADASQNRAKLQLGGVRS